MTIVVAVAVIGLIVVLMGQKSNTVVGKGIETAESEDDYEEPVDILDGEGNVVGEAIVTKSRGGKRSKGAQYTCSDSSGGSFSSEFCTPISEFKKRAIKECKSKSVCAFANEPSFEYGCKDGFKKATWSCIKYSTYDQYGNELSPTVFSPQISQGGKGTSCKTTSNWYGLASKRCMSWCPKVTLFNFVVTYAITC